MKDRLCDMKSYSKSNTTLLRALWYIFVPSSIPDTHTSSFHITDDGHPRSQRTICGNKHARDASRMGSSQGAKCPVNVPFDVVLMVMLYMEPRDVIASSAVNKTFNLASKHPSVSAL